MKKIISLIFLSILTFSLVEPLYARDDSRRNTKQYENPYTYHQKQLTNDNP